VELCTWLAAGGVTPSLGLVRVVRAQLNIPVRVLVRPHGGGFIYDAAERAVIETDAALFGGPVVTGMLDPQGLPDAGLMARMRQRLPGTEITFHRAVDHARDPLRASVACGELGLERVLSSGGRSTALEGAEVLRRMVQHATGDLVIAAAGGITPANVVEVVERTGVREVHFAAQRPLPPASGPTLSSCNEAAPVLFGPDRAKIDGVLNALVKAGLR
jgi:copper homeostasis protein